MAQNSTLRQDSRAPLRPVRVGSLKPEMTRRADGTTLVRCTDPLPAYPDKITLHLERWAREAPDRVYLAQRNTQGSEVSWRTLTYRDTFTQVRAIAQGLLDRDLSVERPVVILSGNDIEQALLSLACMMIGVPYAPISPGYSLLSTDFGKLRYVFDLLTPGLVYAGNATAFVRALDAVPDGVERVVPQPPAAANATPFAALATTVRGDAVDRAHAAVGPDTIAKFLFTSGSTGQPKGVINTQRMMCANAAMMMQVRPRDPNGPLPVFLDWMPWNHTMGGNALFNPALIEGGTLYIDDGRPVPGLFEETLRNLREISPTYYANAPVGYAVLAAAMEKDDALCRSFFKNLSIVAYGGARLPDDLYDRVQALAVRATGERMVFYTGWGSTETGPTSTGTYWDTERVGLIGLPFPGVELKLVPAGPKYELRLRGINVTPGYYRQPELTEAAFDDEGFYCIGDAGVFVDPDDPAQGLIFAGRVVEDFKLFTGTFVQVGPLRTDAIAAASPVVHDALVAGQDRAYVGLLAWPNLHACRQLIGNAEATFEDVVKHPAVIDCLRKGLEAHNAAANGASSLRIARAMLMAEPPSIDGNELTDKGYINQRAGLDRRAALVERLYADPPADDVIVLR